MSSASGFNQVHETDVVHVYDGDNIDAPEIAKLTGFILHEAAFVSTKNQLTIRFETDTALGYRGFQAVYSTGYTKIHAVFLVMKTFFSLVEDAWPTLGKQLQYF